jgi:predicted metal-binding membrane protein
MVKQEMAPTSATVERATVTAMLACAAGCWAVALRLMHGMDMGIATKLGSLPSFAAVWMSMMAAMMLPGAVPAVIGRARVGTAHAFLFVGSYLAIWVLVGAAVYAAYRPHGTSTTAAVVIAAGLYELTPLKGHFRARCRASLGSGLDFGLCCVGSSVGLMLMLSAVGLMSVCWMAIIAAVVLTQKLLPPTSAVDVPLAFAIIGIGVAIFVAPSSIPGLLPSM